jgi:hypothetical protein
VVVIALFLNEKSDTGFAKTEEPQAAKKISWRFHLGNKQKASAPKITARALPGKRRRACSIFKNWHFST